MALRWYVVHTRPMAEYAARRHLEYEGMEVLLPWATTPYPRPGRADAPLFPGYLFIRYDLEGRGSGPVHRVPHVAGLVSFGGVVPAVPDEVMDELSQRIEEIEKTGGVWPRFKSGDLVRVLMGPSDTLGEVVEEASSPGARVTVLLQFLGHLVEARVPRKNLEPVGHRTISYGFERPPRRTRGRGRWIQGFGVRSAATA